MGFFADTHVSIKLIYINICSTYELKTLSHPHDSGTALAPSIMQGRKLMNIFSRRLIMSTLEELVKRIHRYNAQN